MENKPYRLNKWVLFTLSIVSFGLGVLFSILSAYKSNKTFTIVGVIFFLLFTLLMQSFMFRMFKYKPKKEKYLEKYYYSIAELDLVSRLTKANFTFKKNKFGYVAVKIVNKTCYKVTIVDDVKVYLSDDQNKVEDKPTKGIEYCTELVGFEFYTKDEEDIFKKASMLSFSNDKVFYESYLFDEQNNRIVEANAIDCSIHKESYQQLQNILGLVYIGEEIVEK
jgi:hypothetical protein